jgi:hypothetical protein
MPCPCGVADDTHVSAQVVGMAMGRRYCTDL